METRGLLKSHQENFIAFGMLSLDLLVRHNVETTVPAEMELSEQYMLGLRFIKVDL